MNIKNICLSNAEKIYGNPLPSAVSERLDFELSSIEYCRVEQYYTVAATLVERSIRNGLPVLPRRGVASSFIAYLLGITEINPLPAHYICEKCKHVSFSEEKDIFALDDKICPSCGLPMKKDGYNIPVEFFMGYHGDKMPDVQLNFAGKYQKNAVKHLKEIFGEDRVVYADHEILSKIGYCYLCKYFVLPENLKGTSFLEITNNQQNAFLVISILGHNIPTILHNLHKATGIAPKSIPIDIKKLSQFMKKDEAICREELFDILCSNGIEKNSAYTMTEFIRNGRFYGCNEEYIPKSVEIENTLRQHNIPEELISNLKNSRYLPFKAHVLSYALQEYRINWYKEHYPKEFEKIPKD